MGDLKKYSRGTMERENRQNPFQLLEHFIFQKKTLPGMEVFSNSDFKSKSNLEKLGIVLALEI